MGEGESSCRRPRHRRGGEPVDDDALADLELMARDPEADTPKEVLAAPTVIGVDPSRSVLFAQVRQGHPRMWVDQEGYLRPDAWFGPKPGLLEGIMWGALELVGAGRDDRRRCYLGDVASALFRAMGPHDPPVFLEQPGYDEQRWVLEARQGELLVRVESRPYWGFGMMSRGFLNRIELLGPLAERARLVFELQAILVRRPWEPLLRGRWVKRTGASLEAHTEAWEGLLGYAERDYDDRIDVHAGRLERLREQVEDEEAPAGWDREAATAALDRAADALEAAREARRERASAAVERALGRAEGELVAADPSSQVLDGALEGIGEALVEQVIEVEATDGEVVTHASLPSGPVRQVPAEVRTDATSLDHIDAADLLDEALSDDTWDPDGAIPLVDLTDLAASDEAA